LKRQWGYGRFSARRSLTAGQAQLKQGLRLHRAVDAPIYREP
jgi:hypothetical protein